MKTTKLKAKILAKNELKTTESITVAAGILALGVLLSRVLGYVREMLLAWHFGAGAETDAFYAAFQIPDLLNYFLSGGALSIAFIPLYNKVRIQDGDEAAADLMAKVLGTLGLSVFILTWILFVFAPQLMALQFPAFSEDTLKLTTQLTRIVLPAQIFFIVGGVIQAVLLAHKHFVAAAIAPLVYNMCIIMGGVLLHEPFGITGFAYGTLAGAFLGPFVIPLLFMNDNIPVRLKIAVNDKQFLRYLKLALPLMLGQTLLTLDEWYGRWFGALLDEGVVAHLSYARRLMQVPVAVAGQAVAAAALPTLSQLWAEGNKKDLNRVMQETLSTVLSLSVLLAAAITVLAYPGVRFVYQHGAFTPEDTVVVAGLVALFAFAVPGWVIQQVVVRGFYARGDTLRPMILGTVLSLSLIPLYWFLSKAIGVQGIVVAGVTGMTFNAFATMTYARMCHAAPVFFPLFKTFLRVVLVALWAGLAAAWLLIFRTRVFPMEAMPFKLTALFDLALGGGMFALVAIAGLMTWGDESINVFLKKKARALRRKLRI